jgi:hypothetical protein
MSWFCVVGPALAHSPERLSDGPRECWTVERCFSGFGFVAACRVGGGLCPVSSEPSIGVASLARVQGVLSGTRSAACGGEPTLRARHPRQVPGPCYLPHRWMVYEKPGTHSNPVSLVSLEVLRLIPVLNISGGCKSDGL